MILLRQTALILFLSLSCAVLAYVIHPDAPVFETSSLEVKLARAESFDQALWVDARIGTQYERGHHPGAILLNEERWEELFAEFIVSWSPERAVIVYCSSASCARSHEVASRLRRDLGVENIFALRGGWEVLQRQ